MAGIKINLQTEGAAQAASDIKKVSDAADVLDKILSKSKTGQQSFANATESFRRLNPHLFPASPGGGGSFNGPEPPIISAMTGARNRLLLTSLFASGFSPWVGARGLSQFFGGGGAGGGGGGGIWGGGGFGRFLQEFTLVVGVTHALRIAFEQLGEAFKRGTELFIKSAGLATPTATLAHMQAALGAVGLPKNAAEGLLAGPQFTRGFRMTQESLQSAALVGANRGMLSKENLQAIFNLSEQVSQAWEATLRAADASAASAGQLQQSWQAFATQMADLRADMEEVTAILSGVVQQTFNRIIGTTLAFKAAWEFVLDKLLKFTQAIGLVSAAQPSSNRLPLNSLTSRPESGWEKMGLIINGGISGNNYARETAMNTKQIAQILQKMLPAQNPNAMPISITSTNHQP